jgi:phage pi2 protein 07
MLAGLLHKHGVWIGEAKSTRYTETNTGLGTENQAFKNIIRNFLKRDGIEKWNCYPLPTNKRIDPHDTFKNHVLFHVKTNGRWLIKTAGLLYYPDLWISAFPNAFWVFPRRNVEDILASFARHPKMKNQDFKLERIYEFWKRQTYIASTGPLNRFVFPDRFMIDDKEARALVENVGIKFDPVIFNAWFNPAMWHASLEDSSL